MLSYRIRPTNYYHTLYRQFSVIQYRTRVATFTPLSFMPLFALAPLLTYASILHMPSGFLV